MFSKVQSGDTKPQGQITVFANISNNLKLRTIFLNDELI